MDKQLLSLSKAEASPKRMSVKDIEGNDHKTSLYTGLPNFSIFIALLEYLCGKAERMHVWRGAKEEKARMEAGRDGQQTNRRRSLRTLTLGDELLATLMRLRLGLLVEDVCHRFCISPSYFSRLFTTWIVLLTKELPMIFPWPTKEKVPLHTAPQFLPYTCVLS